ncbi:MAG: zinc ribbon-containing protein [Lachnospiraceae bacterium]|nr:zinc ribbon-containing protein [Lachnospiraceae bacterium]
MKKKVITRICSGLAAAILIMTQVSYCVVYAKESGDTETFSKESNATENSSEDTEAVAAVDIEKEVIIITIKSAEELLAVAGQCNNDSWSIDKRIELNEDISLTDIDFEPIQIFAGTFDGNGHTISGFNYTGSGYADGFFRYIAKTGIVQDLTITGIVSTENEEDCTGGICGVNGGWILNCTFLGKVEGKSETGGIAGENESSGTINNCSVSGRVTGYDRAGGITGANYGVIRNCQNSAGVNSDSSWLEEKDEAGLEWLLEDVSERKLVSGTDIGGIAGYSKGMIVNCTNIGIVGYEHNGYNIGGIVGRQSGQVKSCNNTGNVYGRKDVGGIAGQMEPYISVEEAESISEAVGRLHNLVDKFIDDASDTQDTVHSDFNTLRTYADSALSDADSIAGETTDFVNKNISAVNEVANRLDYIMDRMPYIIDDVDKAIDKMSKVADDLKKVVDALKLSDKVGDDPYDETKYARLSLVSGVGGNVYSDKGAPAENEEVRLTVTPDEGYKLSYIKAVDAKKNEVSLTEAASGNEGSNEYTFVMPAENVVVKVEFEAVMTGASKMTGMTVVSEMSRASEQSDSSFVTYVSVEPETLEEIGESEETDKAENGDVVENTDDSGSKGASETEEDSGNTDTADVKIILESNAGGKADYSVSDNTVTLTVRPNSGYTVENPPTATEASGRQLSVSKKDTAGNVYTFNIEGASQPIKVKITFTPNTDSGAVSDSWSDLSQRVTLLQTQMQHISDIMSNINRIIDGKNYKDLTEDDINKLIDYMVDLAQALSDAGTTLSYILSDLATISSILTPEMKEALDKAGVELNHVIDDLKDVLSYLDSGFGLLRSTILYINGKFDIQFEKLSDGMSMSINSLFDGLGMISSYAGQINNDLKQHSDILETDLRAINDQINNIFQLFVQKIEDVEDLYYEGGGYEDVSDEDIDGNYDGKVENSVNSGIIRGDINIGGIAGSMAIDEEDPEGNAAGSVHYSFGSRYLTKCIISRCKNEGKITAKKDGVGGIAGYMNLGIISGSEAYGSVESTDGEYIGGISGESLALIKSCWSLTSLKGAGYIGGIAGSGNRIQDCYAMALINGSAIRKGEIAGWIETKEDERLDYGDDIKGNFFVSTELNGIDGVSYIGIAEPITYKELLETEGLPLQFRHLQLTFIADDKLVNRMEVEYGKPLEDVEFPKAPPIEGSYGIWPDVSNMTMSGNITLEAEYYDNITTLPSAQIITDAEDREGNLDKPYAYIDGIYTGDAALNVSFLERNAHETKAYIGKNAPSVSYEITVEGTDLARDAVSKVRIYNPYEKVKCVMENTDGGWKEISYKEYGKYIQVDMKGDSSKYCIISKDVGNVWIIYVAAGAAVLLIIVIVIKRRTHSSVESDKRT